MDTKTVFLARFKGASYQHQKHHQPAARDGKLNEFIDHGELLLWVHMTG